MANQFGLGMQEILINEKCVSLWWENLKGRDPLGDV
jgi:hypothetical protein